MNRGPLARTREERARTRDPRASVQERYATKAEYLARVTEAALELRRGRFLLDEDVVATLNRAGALELWKD